MTALTVGEAATYLAMTEDQVRHLIRSGQIEEFHLNGQVRIARDELERYVAEHAEDAAGKRHFREGN